MDNGLDLETVIILSALYIMFIPFIMLYRYYRHRCFIKYIDETCRWKKASDKVRVNSIAYCKKDNRYGMTYSDKTEKYDPYIAARCIIEDIASKEGEHIRFNDYYLKHKRINTLKRFYESFKIDYTIK